MIREGEKNKTCWRCRKCGFTTPIDQATCSNPSCRADLSLYGEPFTPGVQQEPVREEKKVDPPQYDSKHQSSSNLWEESPKQKEPKKKAEAKHEETKKVSRKEKKALKKQQAEARAQEKAAQRSLYHRGSVKTFFLSLFIILISLFVGIIVGYIPVFFFFETDLGSVYHYFYRVFPWYAVVPGLAVIALSVLLTRLSLRDKEDRKQMYFTVGLWLIPFVVSSWRKFLLTGGDDSEMYSVYLFFLFIAEPVLVGSTFAGVKGLNRASSILRWIGIFLLVVSGILAVILTVNTYFASIL